MRDGAGERVGRDRGYHAIRLAVVMVACGLVLTAPGQAETVAHQCRRLCADEVAACVAAGGRRLPCRRQFVRACKRDGVAVCVQPGESTGEPRGVAQSAGMATPTDLTATVASASSIRLAWVDTNSREVSYVVERSGSATSGYTTIASLSRNSVNYVDTGLPPATTRYYRVRAAGRKGSFSSYSNVASATTPPAADTSAPSTPALTGSASGCNTASLSWSAATDQGGSGLSGYRVYRNAILLKTVLAPATSTLDGGLQGATSYPYQVTAVDNAGNASQMSNVAMVATPACATTTSTTTSTTTTTRPPTTTTTTSTSTTTTTPPDVTAPSVPGSPATAVVSCQRIDVSWGPSFDTGGSGLRGYNVYRNNQFHRLVLAPATTMTDASLAASTVYSYSVSSLDNAGNESLRSAVASANTPACPDTVPPAVPTGLGASAASCSLVNLSWTATTDTGGSGLRAYNVYRNGAFLQQVMVPGTATTDATVAAGVGYSYQLTAVDNAGNASSMSAAATATTPTCPSAGTGSYRWSRVWGGADHDIGRAVGVGADGSVAITGNFKSTADFGGGPLTAVGSTDVYVAKYTATGAHVWSRMMGGIGTDAPSAIAVDGRGDVIVVGKFAATVDFGSGPVTAAGMEDVFVAKYAAATGAHVWSYRFGGTLTDIANSVAVDGNDNVVVAGVYGGSVNFGGGNLVSVGTYDAFLLKLSPAGAHVWSGRYGSLDYENVWGVTCDPSGNVLVVGNFSTTMNLGAVAVTASGETDAYVAKYSPTGAPLWARAFGGTGPDTGLAIASDANGNIGVGGTFSGTINLGGGGLTAISGNDMFLAKLTSAGAHVWSRSAGGTYSDAVRGVGFDGAGNLVATGNFAASANFGGGLYTTPNNSDDVFVAKYSPTGGHVWSKRYGDVITDMGQGLAVDAAGNTLVVGYFQISIDLGGGRVWGPGNSDVFLLSLAP